VAGRAPGGGVGVVFALIFGLYVLLMSGHTYSPDEETLLASAEALGLHGTFAIPRSATLVEVPGADGRFYSQYGPGQPLAAVPWVWAGHGLAGLLGADKNATGFIVRLALGSFGAAVTAGLAAVFYALVGALGVGRRGAGLLTGLLAFATFLWPLGRTFFAEPLTGLLLFGAFAALAGGRSSGRAALGAGLLAGLVAAVKIQYVLGVPALGALAAWQANRLWRAGDRAGAGHRLGGFVAGGLLGGLPLLAYNTLVFGGPASSGYQQSFASIFTLPVGVGLNGLLLSPGKGLWLYAPPVLLGLAGLLPFARRWPALALTLAGVVGPPLILFSIYRFWPGDGAWGPRYLLPFVPFLLLPALALLPAADAPPLSPAQWSAGRRLLAAGIVGLGGAGLAVQALGAAVNFDTYINLVNDDQTRYWNATYSPLRGHWTVLNARLGDWAARRGYPDNGVALLTGGVSYSEGDKYAGDLFPRWTTGTATVGLPVAAYPLTLTVRLADHRPPTLPRAEMRLALAGQPIAAVRRPVGDSPIESVLTATIPAPVGAQAAQLTLTSPTWNPKQAGVGARNENLGLLIESLALQDATGRLLRLADALPMQPYYPAQRWYYDTQSAHLADHWAWYLWAAQLPGGVAWPLVAGVLLAGLGSLGWGAWRWRRG